MALAIALAVAGVALLVVVFVRFGNLVRETSIASLPGLGALVGIGLIGAAIPIGLIANGHRQDRVKFDETLVKMFGHAPDHADIEGDSLTDLHGFVTCDGKKYKVETRITGMNNRQTSFEVTATPVLDPK